MDDSYDVAIVGAGPNGLTAAAYLARAGARVIVLEARFERGGTLASDDYSTPFTYNLAQLLLPAGTDTPPYRDLGLADHAVAFVTPEVAFATTIDGETLTIGRGGEGLGTQLQGLVAEANNIVGPLLYRPVADAESMLGDAPRLAGLTPESLARMGGDERGAVILRYACALAGFAAGDVPLGPIGAFCVSRLFEPTMAAGGSKSLANGLFRVAARAGARCLVSTRVVALEPAGETWTLRLARSPEGARRGRCVHAGPPQHVRRAAGRRRCRTGSHRDRRTLGDRCERPVHRALRDPRRRAGSRGWRGARCRRPDRRV